MIFIIALKRIVLIYAILKFLLKGDFMYPLIFDFFNNLSIIDHFCLFCLLGVVLFASLALLCDLRFRHSECEKDSDERDSNEIKRKNE